MNILKKILTILLCLGIFLSFTAGVAAFSLRGALDPDAVAEQIATPDFTHKVCESVSDALRRKTALIVITPEDISDILTEDVITRETALAIHATVENILGGKADPPVFESDELYGRIKTLLEEYSRENGVEYAEDSAEQVYEMITDTVTSQISVIDGEYTAAAGRIMAKAQKVLAYWYVPVILWAVLAAAVILMGRSAGAVYNAVLPTYLGAFTALAAAVILDLKDYLGNTVLGNGVFGAFVSGAYHAVLSRMIPILATVSAVLLLFGVTISVITAVRKKNSATRKI